jgi:hypothetical protein
MINILFVYVLRPLLFSAPQMTHNVRLLVGLLTCGINFTNMYNKALNETALRVSGD